MDSIRQYAVPKIERKCLVEEFALKNLGRNVRLEVAKVEDTDLIRKFLNDEFVGREPMNLSIGLTQSEFAVFIDPLLAEFLIQHVSILAIDDGCLCGLFINNLHKTEHTGQWKEPKMKEDYGEEFDKNETPSENFKKIAVMLDEVDTFVPQNLPEDVKEYFRLEILSVHRVYVRNGLAKKLTIEGCKLAFELGYKFAQITGSSVVTNHIARGMGFKEIFSLDIKKFKSHGERVFPDEFPDGGKQITSYLMELQKLSFNS